MSSDINTANDFFVGRQGTEEDMHLIWLIQPIRPIPRDQALRMAAWIVACMDPMQDDFPKVLEAVLNT